MFHQFRKKMWKNTDWVIVLWVGFCLGVLYRDIQMSLTHPVAPKKEKRQVVSVQEIDRKKLPKSKQRFLKWRDDLWSFPLIENK